MIESLLPDEVLALTLWGEARGESISGQVAIANVIINRFYKNMKKYKTIKDVCLEPFQFSCWNKDDPNYSKLMELADGIISHKINDASLKQCIAVSRCIIRDEFLDNTKKAVNYMTTSLFNSPNKPSWARNAKNIIIIGNHTFFTA